MYVINDKRRLYWLINQYLLKKIDAWEFTSEFHVTFDLEIDMDTLNDLENRLFDELSMIGSRFSSFEEDLMLYPGVYFTEEELRAKVIQTMELLKDEFRLLRDDG